MGFGIMLLMVFLFGPPIYQFIYFANYYTVSRVKAFFVGFGYWTILTVLLFFPIMFAWEYGTVAIVVAIILALLATGGVFYLIFKKRRAALAEEYPDEKFLAIKEMIACLGMMFGAILMLFGVIFAIFLPFMRKRD